MQPEPDKNEQGGERPRVLVADDEKKIHIALDKLASEGGYNE